MFIWNELYFYNTIPFSRFSNETSEINPFTKRIIPNDLQVSFKFDITAQRYLNETDLTIFHPRIFSAETSEILLFYKVNHIPLSRLLKSLLKAG